MSHSAQLPIADKFQPPKAAERRREDDKPAAGVLSVAQSQPTASPPQRDLQPPCPTCGLPMWLVRRSSIDDDRDLRTFKCQVCEHTESAIIQFR